MKAAVRENGQKLNELMAALEGLKSGDAWKAKARELRKELRKFQEENRRLKNTLARGHIDIPISAQMQKRIGWLTNLVEEGKVGHVSDVTAAAALKLMNEHPGEAGGVDVSIQPLTCELLQAFGAHLSKPKCDLNVLIMDRCGITDEGLKFFAMGLKNNASLRTLSLQGPGQAFGPEGVKFLAQALGEHETLEKLNLSDTTVGDGGAEHLAEMLKTNTSILN